MFIEETMVWLYSLSWKGLKNDLGSKHFNFSYQFGKTGLRGGATW